MINTLGNLPDRLMMVVSAIQDRALMWTRACAPYSDTPPEDPLLAVQLCGRALRELISNASDALDQ